MPLALRLDDHLRALLNEGARRTHHNQQQLIRLTLRRHLSEVIQAETPSQSRRVTSVDPWPKGALARVYRRAEPGWVKPEDAAVAAQGVPSWED